MIIVQYILHLNEISCFIFNQNYIIAKCAKELFLFTYHRDCLFLRHHSTMWTSEFFMNAIDKDCFICLYFKYIPLIKYLHLNNEIHPQQPSKNKLLKSKLFLT